MLIGTIFIVTLFVIVPLSIIRITNKDKHITILSDRQVDNLKHPKEEEGFYNE